MVIELRHLRCFVVLAEELHFGNAAKRLHITQPPLSTSLQQLEDFLGAKLFHRDSRSVRLTSVGKDFLPEAIRTLAQARSTEEFGRALGSGSVGQLDIAFTSSMLFHGMPEVVHAYTERHRDVAIRMNDMPVAEQNDSIKRMRMHCGFCPGQQIDPSLSKMAFPTDDFVCCVHKEHWLAEKQLAPLATLADEEFIVFSRDATLMGYRSTIALFHEAGFSPREKIHVRQWITAVLMVSKGFGVAIVPAGLRHAAIENVRFIPLAEARQQISGHFIWNPEAVSPALENLIRTVALHQAAQAAATTPRCAKAITSAGGAVFSR